MPTSLKTAILSRVAYGILRLLFSTYRISWQGLDARKTAEAMHNKRSFCIAIWHEHSFTVVFSHRGQKFAPLASLSKDGDFASLLLQQLGFRPIRGSSSKGGKLARSEMEDMISLGWFTALTVDGPRGPRRVTKPGIVDIARKTGVAILPLVTVASKYWELRSWDKFKIPKPFAKVVVVYGEPIMVPSECEGEAFSNFQLLVTEHLTQAESFGLRALKG